MVLTIDGATTLSIMTQNITRLIIMTHNITTLSSASLHNDSEK
jgi:hypothetical protein